MEGNDFQSKDVDGVSAQNEIIEVVEPLAPKPAEDPGEVRARQLEMCHVMFSAAQVGFIL